MRACGPVLDRSLSTEVISPFLSLRASLLKIHFSFPSADGVSEIRGGKGGKESWKHHRNVTHEEARASLLVLDIHSYSNRTLSFCFVKTHSHVGGLCSLKKTFVLILFFFFFNSRINSALGKGPISKKKNLWSIQNSTCRIIKGMIP